MQNKMRKTLWHLPSVLAVCVTTLMCCSAAAQTSVHIAMVDTGVMNTGHGILRGGHRYYGEAIVVVVDDLGNPVPNARVRGTFYNAHLQTGSQSVSGTTGSDGSVTLRSRASSQGVVITFTFCVDDVRAFLPYDSADNLMTCDTETLEL